ncbi:Prolipoprotein diacylglyceryl transferase [bacterium HR39]|nr:Prolipoprotein diacylglyceryl transferase [bacterium HR39]
MSRNPTDATFGRSAHPASRARTLPLFAIPFPAFDPVAIRLGPLAIRWYALAYLAGLVLGWLLAKRLVRRPGWSLTPEFVDDFLFHATLGVVLGGRLGYVLFYNLPYYVEHPLEVFMVWRGGMSFHGGLLGVAVAALWAARRWRVPAIEVFDLAAAVAPLGLFFGRIANFVNGELWGRPTDVPWAVVFPNAGDVPRHPSQLYEAALEGLVLFAVVQALAWRIDGSKARGLLSGIFLTGYALARIFVEFFREPDPQLGYLLGFLTMGQILSLPLLVAGVLLIRHARGGAG